MLTAEKIDEVLNAAYTELVATTGYNGGMGGHQWDQAAARAIERAVLESSREGYVLVPRWPTPAMHDAMLKWGTKKSEWNAILDAAMLAASPPDPASQPVGQDERAKGEILPRPFCGGKAAPYPDGDMEGHSIICTGKGALFGGDKSCCPMTTFDFASHDEAVAAWNRRASQPVSPAVQRKRPAQ